MSDLIKREDAIDVVNSALRGEIPFVLIPNIIMNIPSVKEEGYDSPVEHAREGQSPGGNRQAKDL